VKRALLDTSFMIALARGEDLPIEDPPDEAAISAVTLCGLHHGVLVATDEQRPGRLATLVFAERRFAALPVDVAIAPHYGRLVAGIGRRTGRRLATADALIAATAAAHRLPLITRDHDFAGLDGIEAVIV
jgi:predicted nucleic acid-binding protein